jgi:hypothetical protein
MPLVVIEDTLLTIQSNILTQLEDMTENPKLDYSVGGQSFSWESHFNNLMSALKTVNEQLAEGSPTELRSISA